jgi:hypothetical protein
MSRSVGFGVAVTAVAALAMVLCANSPSALAGGNCQDKLVGNTYNCTYSANDGTMGTDCVAFSSGGSGYFDALYSGVVSYTCVCVASGSLSSPKFDASSSAYECTRGDFPESISGKVKGKKLTDQGVEGDGSQFIEECTITSTPCS